MNRYERFVSRMGFLNPVLGKTKNPADEVVGLHFEDYDPATTRRVLGRCKHYQPNRFFYRLSKTRAVLVDTERKTILLANSARAVAAFAKTVNI